MTELGGTTTSSPLPTRLVVAVGGGVPATIPAIDAVALDARGLRRAIDDEAARLVDAATQRREAIEASLAGVDADLAAVSADLAAELERRRGREEALAGQVGAIDAVTQRRRAHLESLTAAVTALGDATRQWCKVLEQQESADGALDSLCFRLGGPDAPASPEAVAAEMAEGEQVLERTEAARREAVATAVERLAAVHSVLAADPEPLRLAGLLRLRDAIEGGPTGSTSALEARRDDLERRRRELHVELGSAAPEVLDVPTFVLGAVDRLEPPAGGTVVLDDAFARLGDDDCTAVLTALAGRPGGRPLVYLTDDVRVLSWAIGLPPDVGGVAGAVTPTPRPEQ